MKLIDADALKTELDAWARIILKPDYYAREDAIKEIDNAPTIDAVPVVRCGECSSAKWYESGDFYCRKWGERFDSPYTLTGQSKTDFCSHGSKKRM